MGIHEGVEGDGKMKSQKEHPRMTNKRPTRTQTPSTRSNIQARGTGDRLVHCRQRRSKKKCQIWLPAKIATQLVVRRWITERGRSGTKLGFRRERSGRGKKFLSMWKREGEPMFTFVSCKLVGGWRVPLPLSSLVVGVSGCSGGSAPL
jgi:hypothetical protein